VRCLVRNTGDRAGAEVVQLYFRDPVAQVTRPVQQLLGFARVELAAHEATEVTFRIAADRFAYTGVDLARIVEAGAIELMVGSSSADIRHRHSITLIGPTRVVGRDRHLRSVVEVGPQAR